MKKKNPFGGNYKNEAVITIIYLFLEEKSGASFWEAFNKSNKKSGPAGQHRKTLKDFHLLWSPPLSQHHWRITSWVIPQHNCYCRILTYCLTCGPFFLTTIPKSPGNLTCPHEAWGLCVALWPQDNATSLETDVLVLCKFQLLCHGAQEAGYLCAKILLLVRWEIAYRQCSWEPSTGIEELTICISTETLKSCLGLHHLRVPPKLQHSSLESFEGSPASWLFNHSEALWTYLLAIPNSSHSVCY